MLGELNGSQINNVLSSQMVGRIACTDGNQPYIVPVTYSYNGKFIYGQTSEGVKLNILRKNPNVCFEVDIMTDMANWQSVVVYGLFEELKEEEAREARKLLFDRISPLKTSSTIHEQEETLKTEDNKRIKLVMYRIKIIRSTGRFEKK